MIIWAIGTISPTSTRWTWWMSQKKESCQNAGSATCIRTSSPPPTTNALKPANGWGQNSNRNSTQKLHKGPLRSLAWRMGSSWSGSRCSNTSGAIWLTQTMTCPQPQESGQSEGDVGSALVGFAEGKGPHKGMRQCISGHCPGGPAVWE